MTDTTCRVSLRRRDVDQLGHVNSAVYHELLEDVRATFFRRVLPAVPVERYVLARSDLEHRREARLADEYLVGRCWVRELGRSRIELGNELRLPDGQVAVTGTATFVGWDGQRRASRPLTHEERAALAPHVDAAP